MSSKEPSHKDLRAKAKELGINAADIRNQSKAGLAKMIEQAEAGPVDPDDFGDLGEVVEAPDEETLDEKLGADEELVDEADVKPVEIVKSKKEKPRPVIKLTAKEIVTAMKNGLAGGAPQLEGQAPVALKDGSILVGKTVQQDRCSIAGLSVLVTVESSHKMVSWVVEGSADDLSGKYRLLNDISLVLEHGMVKMKAGSEFFDHQVDIKRIKEAGGVFIALSADDE